MEGVRSAVPGDLAEIIRLERMCFGIQAYSPRLLYTLLTLFPEFFLVYRVGDRITGYASGVKRRNVVCHLMSICVEPSMRRKGVGRSLLAAVEERFSRSGCLVSRLEVSLLNKAALRLYTDTGYRPALYLHDYYPGGEPALIMYKPLQAAETNYSYPDD